jgi:CRP/FNR family transcriptional regulator, cyclic AMP receptor protein
MSAARKSGLSEIAALAAAVRRNKGADSRQWMEEKTWAALAEVLVRRTTEQQECLIREGGENRSVYFLESGLVRVYRAEGDARLQLAVLGPGAVIGEATFFSPSVRGASVETLEASPVWELTSEGYEQLTRSSPDAAAHLCRYLGAVVVNRMLSGTGRLLMT